MTIDLRSVNTVVDEGNAFLDRHPDLRGNSFAAETGALAWGLLRALMACDNCPGYYRVPLDKDWDKPGGRLYCSNCQGVWTRVEDAPEPKPATRKRKKDA